MASVEDHSLQEVEIDDDDLCPICRQLLHRPVVTECSHTLCELCMAEWADVSVISQMTIVPLGDQPEDFGAANLEAKCPMCRTLTSAKRSVEVEDRVRGRHPDIYQQREEEAEADAATKDSSVDTLTVYIGNTVKPPEDIEDEDGKGYFEWNFFVNVSDTSVISAVEIHLHETFKPQKVVRYKAPYSVCCRGWGTFVIRADVILKTGYSWISNDARDTQFAKRVSLPLEWGLSFDGEGRQARCQLKIKNERRSLRLDIPSYATGRRI